MLRVTLSESLFSVLKFLLINSELMDIFCVDIEDKFRVIVSAIRKVLLLDSDVMGRIFCFRLWSIICSAMFLSGIRSS